MPETKPVPLLERLFIVLALACSISSLNWDYTVADPDIFARVAVGRAFELTGWVLPRDPFSFLSGERLFIDHEWLSGLLFYRLSQWGAAYLWWGKWLSLGAFCFLLGSINAQRSRAAFLLGTSLAAFGCQYVWRANLRSQISSYIFLAVLLYTLEAFERGERRMLWILPPIFALWANLHGGWALGWVGLAIYAVGNSLRRKDCSIALLGALVACLLATLLNPYGFSYWLYLADALRMSRPHIVEWQSISPISPLGLILLMLVGFTIAGATYSRERLAHYLLFVFSLFVSFLHLRLVGFFFLVLSAFMIEDFLGGLTRFGRIFGSRRQQIGSASLLLARFGLVLGTLSFFLHLGEGFSRFDTSPYPEQAVNWLWSSGYEGKLLVNFNEGSFALWRLFPRFRVSVDGRFEEVYEENVVEQTHCALSSKCSRQKNAIEFINPDVILSEKSQFALNASLAYKRVYADERHEVFVRVGLEPVNGPGEITDLWDAHFKAEDLVNGKELINHGDTGNKAATS